MVSQLLVLSLLGLSVFASLASAADSGKAQAVVVIYPSPTGERIGTLFLEEVAGTVTITGSIHSLPANSVLGFHVHESGDTRNVSHPCDSTGTHFNPEKVTHGAPTDAVRHVGDLGNIQTDAQGAVEIAIKDNVLSILNGSPHSILGRAFVVHQKVDDLGRGGVTLSKSTGNAGSRLACGLVGTIYQK